MRKKVLFLITKSNWGGAQRYVYDLATHLDPQAFEVVVALGGIGQLVERLHEKNISTIRLANLERNISITKEFKSAYELWRIIQSVKPEILHINSSKAGGLGALVGRLSRVPQIIFTAHGWAFNEERPLWQKYIIKFLHVLTILLSHTTIVVSETTKRQIDFPLAQRKMRVVHNGCAKTNFFGREFSRGLIATHIPELEKYKNDFWSVTIGELHHIKQHNVTIHALAKIVQTHPKVRHIIMGNGEERTNLEALVAKLDLAQNVFFAGYIPEAVQYLKAFDLFVLASKSEALAYVIIEACSAGLPIIASDVGGIPEIIKHKKDGLLFREGNSVELSQQYLLLYENSELRNTLAQNALSRASHFSFEKMFAETTALYVKES